MKWMKVPTKFPDPSIPFTEADAFLMLALDHHHGRVRSQREYAELWQWHRSKVQRFVVPVMNQLSACKSASYKKSCTTDRSTIGPQNVPANVPPKLNDTMDLHAVADPLVGPQNVPQKIDSLESRVGCVSAHAPHPPCESKMQNTLSDYEYYRLKKAGLCPTQ